MAASFLEAAADRSEETASSTAPLAPEMVLFAWSSAAAMEDAASLLAREIRSAASALASALALSMIDAPRSTASLSALSPSKITEGPITVFKASGLLDEYYVDSGTLLENLNEFNLCRTQIRLQLNDINYFLTESIGNHHLIVKGDHADLVDEFFRWL